MSGSETSVSSRTVTLDEAFALAFDHHRSGRLAEAAAIYRQILSAVPGRAPSHHHSA